MTLIHLKLIVGRMNSFELISFFQFCCESNPFYYPRVSMMIINTSWTISSQKKDITSRQQTPKTSFEPIDSTYCLTRHEHTLRLTEHKNINTTIYLNLINSHYIKERKNPKNPCSHVSNLKSSHP